MQPASRPDAEPWPHTGAVLAGGAGRRMGRSKHDLVLPDGRTMLEVVAPKLIVQSWRSTQFRDEDPDSTLILMLSADVGAGRIDLVHLDVPDHDYAGVQQGWKQYYWDPWRAFLAGH